LQGVNIRTAQYYLSMKFWKL